MRRSPSRRLGWKGTYGTGKGDDTISSGLEGAWTNNPIQWDNGFFENLFGYDWELSRSPAGAQQWRPTNPEAQDSGAATPTIRRSGTPPMMATTDIALITDPVYKEISQRFHENPDQFADAFARAWYKLLHRDMGPVVRYLGPWVPDEELLWQDPVPAVDHELVDDADVAALKGKIADAGLSVVAARVHRMGVGIDLPRHRQARRRQRSAHPPVAAGRMGHQRHVRCVARGRPHSRASSRTSTVRSRAARRSRSPT